MIKSFDYRLPGEEHVDVLSSFRIIHSVEIFAHYALHIQ